MIFEHIAPYITPIINCLGVINLIILGWAFLEINKLSKRVHPSNYYDFQGSEPATHWFDYPIQLLFRILSTLILPRYSRFLVFLAPSVL